MASAHDKILIVDFGSQVTQLIARRVREEGVYSEIVPFQKAEAAFTEMKPKAVILSGGPESVHEAGSPRAPQAIFDSGVPVLGICYGQMTMAAQLGGEVEGGHHREFGRADVEVKAREQPVRFHLGHGRKASGLDEPWRPHHQNAAGLCRRRRLANAPFAVIQDEKRKYYGLMFHPEVVHTPDGAKLIRNFVRKVAGLTGDWTMRAFREEAIEKIRAQVGKGRVICGLSGGVDSAVAAVLIHEAIGDQLTCVFVDHGMLRLDEAKTVVDLFRHHYNIPLVHVDASKLFLGELAGVTDPELKRKTIGRLFIDVFDARSEKDRRRRFPGAGHALSRRDRERLVHRRPLGDDQVAPQCRRPAGAHEHEAGRAACANCSRTKSACSAANSACPKFSSAATRSRAPASPSAAPATSRRKSSTSCAMPTPSISIKSEKPASTTQIWQAFAVLLPVKTVGVMGDGRTYEYVVGLRAVTSTDGMTADFYPFDMKFLGRDRDADHQRGEGRQPGGV